MPSLPRAYLEIMCWWAHWSREDGQFYFFVFQDRKQELFCKYFSNFQIEYSHLHFRWFARIEHSFPVITCVEILFLAAITIVQNIAMPWKANLHYQLKREVLNLVKRVLFLARRFTLYHSLSSFHSTLSLCGHFIFYSYCCISQDRKHTMLTDLLLGLWISHLNIHIIFLVFNISSGEIAYLSTFLPLALSSGSMSSLQSSCKTILSLWLNGACLWVHIFQYSIGKGANGCSLVWWALS